MAKRIKRFCKHIFSLTKSIVVWSVLALAAYILFNSAVLELQYMKKYENSHAQMVREHDRQLVVGQMIQSQIAWEETSQSLKVAYLEERAERIHIERKLSITQHEIYLFFRHLEKLHPGVVAEVIGKTGPSRVNMFPDILPVEAQKDSNETLKLEPPLN